MRTSPKNQHCMMKKGIGSMMVLGSYLTTMRNSVTVIAATSHACWPSFLWNFLMRRQKASHIAQRMNSAHCYGGSNLTAWTTSECQQAPSATTASSISLWWWLSAVWLALFVHMINLWAHLTPRRCYLRVIHEVIDFPHGYPSHVDKKDKAEQH